MSLSSKQTGSFDFDLTDKKILYAYSQNCRLNQKDLAGDLRISPETLNYRIQKLRDEIFEPALAVDLTALPINTYVLFIDNASMSRYETLRDHKSTHTVARIIGDYECFAVITTRDIDGFLSETLSKAKTDTYHVADIQVDDYNPWQLDMQTDRAPTTKPLDMTPQHHDVLHGSMEHPDASAYELSKHIDYDYRTIKKYQEELHEHGIIKKWRYQIDIFSLGFKVYFIHVNAPAGEVKTIKEQQYQDDYSGLLYRSQTDVFFWYMPRTSKNLHDFTQRLHDKNNDVSTNVYEVGSEYAINITPASVKETIKAHGTQA